MTDRFCPWLLVVAVITSSVTCEDQGKYLTIPSLGRHAQLGYLYDERTEEFLGVDVFNGPVFGGAITTTEMQSTNLQTQTIETNADKFNILDVSVSIKANFLSGKIIVEGKAGYLNAEIKSARETTGLMHCEVTTVVENLNLYYDELKPKYNTDLVNEKGATHVVSEIKWGGGVAILFSQKFSDETEKTKIKGELFLSFQFSAIKIAANATVNINNTDIDKTTDFSINVFGDMLLPNQTPKTIEEVHQLIQQIPYLTSQGNEGKGRPIAFVLTPINLLRKHLQQTQQINAFAKQVDEAILNDFISLFDSITKTEQSLNDLLDDFDDNSICIDPVARNNLTKLRDSFQTSKKIFQSKMKDALIAARSGSSGQDKLTELVKSYSKDEYSTGQVKRKLQAFDDSVAKITLYKTALKDYPNVTYLGHLSNLEANLLSNLKNVVYILFLFPPQNENDMKSQRENNHLFFVRLYKPLNVLFVVDCYFEFAQCNSLNRTVIQQIVNGIVNVKDVKKDLKLQKLSNLLQMKALGRFAEMGQLYNIRTNTFLPGNFFTSEIPKILIKTAKNNRVESHEISSETIKGKFKALNVDPELQYSILGDLFQWSSSGKYFAREEEFGVSPLIEKSKCPARSFFHIRRLNEETISLKDETVLKYFATDALSKGATHFVVTIEYGFLSIFQAHTIEEDSKINNKYLNRKNYERKCAESDPKLESFATKLRNIVNRIKIPETSSSYEFPKILSTKDLKMLYGSGAFSVKVYSDIQGPDSPPERISNRNELQFFVSNVFIRQQMSINGGKGVPVAYVLYPLANLSRDAGIISPFIPYQQLSSHSLEPFDLVDIFDEVSLAKNQIDDLLMIMTVNADCVADSDLALMKSIRKDFDSTIGKFQKHVRNYIRNIKSGQDQVEKMKELLKEYKSLRVFDNTRRYFQLQYLNNATEKLSVCNELKNENVTYFGRSSAGNTFSDLFDWLAQSPFCVFYYRYSWEKTHIESWRENKAFFLNLANDKKSKMFKNLIVINCEFEGESCNNVTRPVIHAYVRGVIASYDYLATVKGNGTVVPEGSVLSKRMTKLEVFAESVKNKADENSNLIDLYHPSRNRRAHMSSTNITAGIDFPDLDGFKNTFL